MIAGSINLPFFHVMTKPKLFAIACVGPGIIARAVLASSDARSTVAAV